MSGKYFFLCNHPLLLALTSPWPLFHYDPWASQRGVSPLIRAEHCLVLYSLHIDQLWVSVLITNCKKLLWQWERDVLICGHKFKCIVVILILCSFHRVIVVDSMLGLWSSQSWVLSPIKSTSSVIWWEPIRGQLVDPVTSIPLLPQGGISCQTSYSDTLQGRS